MYGKVFDSIYDGTLYGHWEAIVTMQQLIVLATPDGVVDMTPNAIAARTSIPLDIIKKGLTVLESPDPYSRTPGEDGRRIVPMDEHRPWGWRLVNHGKYMRLRNMTEKRAADRERIAEKRKKNKGVASESQSVANVAHSDSDLDLKKHSAFALPDWVPQDAWDAWLEVRLKVKAANTARALKLALNELDRLRGLGSDPRAVLEAATLKGWRGLFPVSAGLQPVKVDL